MERYTYQILSTLNKAIPTLEIGTPQSMVLPYDLGEGVKTCVGEAVATFNSQYTEVRASSENLESGIEITLEKLKDENNS